MQTKLLINGVWQDAQAGGKIAVINPANGAHLADIAEARAEDVDLAVTAAKSPPAAWAAMAAHDRGQLLLRLADRIEQETAELARLSAGYRPSDQ